MIVARYPRFADVCNDTYHPPTMIDKLDNQWFYGPTGTGKSTRARTENPSLYSKGINKWFDGYDGETTVLIEDVDTAHTFMLHFLKIWADHYPFRAEYKGGSRMIRPAKIVVTSNHTISEIFGDGVDSQALQRRFTEIEML